MNTQRIAPGFFLAVLLFALPSPVVPQSDGDPIQLGHYRVFPSEILGEDRTLQLYLPRGYDEADIAYPVVYLFYSELLEVYFAQAVNELALLSIDRMPQVILVGVPNTQRYRDLLAWPQEGRPDTGHADRFLRFLREELIPFVDSEYRTKPYRIMVGPQAAAVFGAYTLVEAPETFQAFLLNDPCRQDSDERSLCREVVELAATTQGRGTYFSVSHEADDERWEDTHLEGLRDGLNDRAVEGFRWRIARVPDWPLFLPPLQLREGLLDLFADYPFEAGDGAPALTRIRAHYESLSLSYGFTLDPPNHILARSSDQLVERGDYDEALEVLSHLVELHPSSLDGRWRLANLHRVMGDTATAIRYYRECLRRDPNMTPAREWLERLGGG